MNLSFIKLNIFFLSTLIILNISFNIFWNIWVLYLIDILLIIIMIFLNIIFYTKLKKFMKRLWNLDLSSNILKIDKKNNDLTNFKENNDLEKFLKRYILKSNIEKKNLEEIKNTFMKFLPKQIYDEIGEKWYERIALWNFKIKKISIMFIDIAWFTSITEKINHERALFLLNLYFDWIWEIILKNKWYIDKYLWDWIMVIFEDWLEENAIIASIEIQEFIEKFKMWDLWKKISIWIWINYWEVIVWTVWTKKRMEATVLWDVINTASRLENLSRKFDKNIIISESIYKKIENKKNLSTSYLWKEFVKWKEKEISVYWVDNYFII